LRGPRFTGELLDEMRVGQACRVGLSA